MSISEGWVENQDVRIHYIDSYPENSKGIPIVFIPGLSESAEDYLNLMSFLSTRRCVAITFRGRGKSSSPETGYSLNDHVNDIEAVVNHIGLKLFFLMGYSRGVSYAIAYGLRHLQFLAGLIIGDYPAQHTLLPPEWTEWFLSTSWRGKKISERMKPHAVVALQKESEQILFWDNLSSINCPVLILRGGQEDSLLVEEQAEKYLRNLQNAKVEVFKESGHDLQYPDYDRFVKTINNFLVEIDE